MGVANSSLIANHALRILRAYHHRAETRKRGGGLILSPAGRQSQHRNQSLASRYHQGVKRRRPNGREVPGICPLPTVGRADPLADRVSMRARGRRTLDTARPHAYAEQQQRYADDQTHEGKPAELAP